MENDEFKKVHIKNRSCLFWLQEKCYENIFVYDILTKIAKLYLLYSIKYIDLIQFMIRLDETMMPLTIVKKVVSHIYIFFHYYMNVKVDPVDYLSIEKPLTMHNANSVSFAPELVYFLS